MRKPVNEMRAEHSLDDEQSEVIDWSVLSALTAFIKPGKPDLRKKLMTVYLESTPPLFVAANSAILDRDAHALRMAAHSLKSSSLGIGAISLGQTCLELELLGKTNSLATARVLLSYAENQFIAVSQALREALREIGVEIL